MSGVDNAQSMSSEDYSSSEAAEEPGIQDDHGFENYESKTQKKKEEKEK